MEPKEIIEKWLTTMESGEYEHRQTTGTLVSINKDGEACFCALGLLCKVAGMEINTIKSNLFGIPTVCYFIGHPNKLFQDIGMNDYSNRYNIADLNDRRKLSFKEIAAEVRANMGGFFPNIQ